MTALDSSAPVATTDPARTPRGPSRRRQPKRRDRAGYVFLLPWFIGILFTIIPFFASLYLAFTDYNLLNAPQWIGFSSLRAVVGDERLWHSLGVTFA